MVPGRGSAEREKGSLQEVKTTPTLRPVCCSEARLWLPWQLPPFFLISGAAASSRAVLRPHCRRVMGKRRTPGGAQWHPCLHIQTGLVSGRGLELKTGARGLPYRNEGASAGLLTSSRISAGKRSPAPGFNPKWTPLRHFGVLKWSS
ncbi:hypothetical protein P7K49_011884 [Saguinus oedipus]|uniref:Uncharacterized protein n=1 Tax=Saguinus oedipus TaxID=9490 RepID=A0ABQ9VS80_SAGOE|nr:hypothetical protein P7K49_011884 [Saguinus oedipus]